MNKPSKRNARAQAEAGLQAKVIRDGATSRRLDAQFARFDISNNKTIPLNYAPPSEAERQALDAAVHEGQRRGLEVVSLTAGGVPGAVVNGVLISADIYENGVSLETGIAAAAGLVLRKIKIPSGAAKPDAGDWQAISSKADINTIGGGRRGIYRFTDADGITYVGQSKDIAQRLKRHGSRIQEGSEIVFKEVTEAVVGGGRVVTGKLTRETEEFREIRRITRGERAKPFNGIANKVDPIGKTRRAELGLNERTGLPD